MIKTVKQACRFNAAIHDYRMSQGIENLAELIGDEGDGREFFSRNFVTHGMAQLFRDMDNLPQDQLPSFVRLLSRVTEPKGRANLTPELETRAKGADVPIALAAAAVRFAWEPESVVFRMLAALGGATRAERDLAEKYLVRDERPVTTELLRRALAREGRPAVRDQLRRILDVRADRAAAKRP